MDLHFPGILTHTKDHLPGTVTLFILKSGSMHFMKFPATLVQVVEIID